MSEQIPAKQLVALIKGKVSAKQRASDAMSHITSKLKSAKKDANLNKKAFDVVFAAFKMDEDDRDEFFDAIQLYRDFMDENNAWADGQHTGDLVKQAEAAAKSEAPDDDLPDQKAAEDAAVAENVVKLKRGIKKLEDDQTATVEAAKPSSAELAASLDDIPEALERRPSRMKKPKPIEESNAGNSALNELTDAATAVH